jgi:hypothetical protein
MTLSRQSSDSFIFNQKEMMKEEKTNLMAATYFTLKRGDFNDITAHFEAMLSTISNNQ